MVLVNAFEKMKLKLFLILKSRSDQSCSNLIVGLNDQGNIVRSLKGKALKKVVYKKTVKELIRSFNV